MHLATIRALALAITLLPAIAQAQNQAPPTLTFKQLTEDTTLKTPSGATFTVASGWHAAQGPTLIVIHEPEKELAAAFVEVSAPTVEEAIAEAWKRWRPDWVRRRLIELLFDANEEAEQALAFGLKQTEEAIKRQSRRSR